MSWFKRDAWAKYHDRSLTEDALFPWFLTWGLDCDLQDILNIDIYKREMGAVQIYK